MRKDSAPQIETCEIDDTELDGVSGGLNIGGLNLAPVTGIAPSITAPLGGIAAPVSGISAAVAGVTAPVGGIMGSI